MHVPPMYRPRSVEEIWSVITENPLALLVSNGSEVPHATQLPVIAMDAAAGEIVGRQLVGHLNRANPHWDALQAEETTLAKLVFSGPASYISPALYDFEPAAPTWDFVTVHLHGALGPIDADEGVLPIVSRTAAKLEERFGYGWDQAPSLDYFRSLAPGVGAFTFTVSRVDAMFKLSQELDPALRTRIGETLDREPPRGRRGVGELIAAGDPIVAAHPPHGEDDVHGPTASRGLGA
jgi:transcriptional regulator